MYRTLCTLISSSAKPGRKQQKKAPKVSPALVPMVTVQSSPPKPVDMFVSKVKKRGMESGGVSRRGVEGGGVSRRGGEGGGASRRGGESRGTQRRSGTEGREMPRRGIVEVGSAAARRGAEGGGGVQKSSSGL